MKIMKNLFYIISLLFFVFTIHSCGISKGYIGKKVSSSELSVIRRVSIRSIKGKGILNLEKPLLAKVDSLVVGSYYKGWPKKIKVKPGLRSIEVRHFKAWDNKMSNPYNYGGGLVGGLAAGDYDEENNPHDHYILTFNVIQGKQYSILFKTNESNIDNPEIFITEENSGTQIPFEVVKKTYNKK